MLRRIPRPLALLLAVAALLVVAWTFTTAPFQGPDEPAHFNYTQHLAETGHRPSGRHAPRLVAGPERADLVQPDQLAGVRRAAGVVEARGAALRRHDRGAGEKGEEDGAGPNPLAKNPPLYYAYQAVPYWLGSPARSGTG